MHKLDTIDYLKNGTPRQKAAYTLLSKIILKPLEAFTPILAGTIPLNIDIASSDLDILCCWTDKAIFRESVFNAFSKYTDFSIREIEMHGNDTVIANFYIDNFEVEIFGQEIPVKQQNGYRHMIIEHAVLEREGDDFRKKIIHLKQAGYKTEPAFAKLLGLQGDPYQALLDYRI